MIATMEKLDICLVCSETRERARRTEICDYMMLSTKALSKVKVIVEGRHFIFDCKLTISVVVLNSANEGLA